MKRNKLKSALKILGFIFLICIIIFFLTNLSSENILKEINRSTEQKNLSKEENISSEIIKTEKFEELSSKEMISKLLELKNAIETRKKTLKFSLISELNPNILEIADEIIEENWNIILKCSKKDRCDPMLFIDLIDEIAKKEKDQRSELISSLIKSYKIWNVKNIIQKSYAISDTDRRVKEMNNPDLNDNWNKIVECNGKCGTLEVLLFDSIKIINNN